MTAVGLVRAARAAGIHLRVDGDRLLAQPKVALTPELRSALAAERAEVVAYLRIEPPDAGCLLEGGRVWIPPPTRPGWCACDQEHTFDRATGLCKTCLTAVRATQSRAATRTGPRRFS